MKLELKQTVYHRDIYDGKEPMKVVGIRETEVELEGDYSGGTHNVCQKSWHSIEGVLVDDSNNDNIKIEEIYSKRMFTHILAGSPKEGMYERELKVIEDLLGNDVPILNLSSVKCISIQKIVNGKSVYAGYVSYGHLTGVKIRIMEDFDVYDFSLIFNFHTELEKMEDVLHKSINLVDWRNNSLKWNISDL